MKKSSLITFFTLILSLLPTFPLQCYAWNPTAHMVIASIAYERLKPSSKKIVDELVHELADEYHLSMTYDSMATWPDSIRSQKIDIFSHWHYIDYAFSADNTPLKNLIDTDNAVWALAKMKPIVSNEKANPPERARFLAFLTHIVSDLHQPLHASSRISAKYPDGDKGGNLYLVRQGATNLKSKNLHSLWDGGVGAFDSDPTPENIGTLAHTITALYPEKNYETQIKDLNPETWAKESNELATTVVYDTPENQIPSTSYVKSSQRTSEERVALAGYRLAALLNELL